MASTTHSKHYMSSRHYAVMSLVMACTCFTVMWIVVTSIQSRINGDSLEIQHKPSPIETLPPRSKQAKLNAKPNDHLNFGRQKEHGEENKVENEHIFDNKTWLPNLGEQNEGESKENEAEIKKNEGEIKENEAEIKKNEGETKENEAEIEDIFHNKEIFLDDYKEMMKKFKIYAYPHEENDTFANIFLPEKTEPGGNYASESYFKKALMQSHYLTNDPTEADLFYLPFSIATMRNDKRVSVGGIQDFIKAYIDKISQSYPYWNRTNGADHFYVACHSVGRTAMEKVVQVKLNAIQVVCSSSYFVSSYVAHKDTSIPQIWPRQGDSMGLSSTKSTLAFFAGEINSPIRAKILKVWKDDSEISVHFGRLPTPYSEAMLKSKFCLHAKGYEVNTARIGDSLYYGCVPIIFADHYDLPFNDILNWKSFSLIVSTIDIPLLKDVLYDTGLKKYSKLQNNALKVRKHFQWHMPPLDYDAFHMVMYELWLRRHVLRVPL
ncbi:probable glycosyltransferase At5g03795 isoform X2 [Cryptomeria japonica]|uniref:probable glycosyltransferase At5g03795 isoform X2 n=1 Tax=Cryptomeria japonica TaxID=3369 RepID=UPI0025AD2A63|nr:probable glycosyltransferase At5g03795 isoform X2 [Cryptomeria japonica]